MDEKRMHRLRNEFNVISVGIALLREQLQGDEREDVRDVLRRMDKAAARCAVIMGSERTPSPGEPAAS